MSDLARGDRSARRARLHGGVVVRHQYDLERVVRIVKDLETDIEGRDVILVEDIVDPDARVSAERARRSSACELRLRPAGPGRAEDGARYAGPPADFVVGYGLDVAEHYRELPSIEPE